MTVPLTAVLILVILSHMGFALSWCAANKRSGFETLAVVVFVAVAWPLFMLRMIGRGYHTYVVSEWPKGFWD